MAMLFDANDAQQYLTGVWIGLKGDKPEGKEVPWFCQDAQPSQKFGGTVLKVLREIDGQERFHKVGCNDEDINIVCPELGAINVGDICLYLSRRNTRQWRRGFRHNHANFFDPGSDFRHYVAQDEVSRYNKDSRNPTLIDAIWNPEYISIEQAVIEAYDGTRYGSAISKDYYIYSNQYCNIPMIGYKSIDVGTIDDNLDVKLFKDCTHLNESFNETLCKKVQ